MADKLKTFVDTTWTLSDVNTATNKLTLVDNGANTQAVVKDIQVNMSKAIKGTINIGNYAVSNELVTLTGSAIVDNNESMVFEIPVPFGIKISRSVPKTVYSERHYATNTSNIEACFLSIVHTPSVTTTTGTTLTEAGIMSKYETVLKVSSFPNTVSSPIKVYGTTSVSSMSQPAWVYRHSDTMLYYFRYDGDSVTFLYVSTNNGVSWSNLNNDSYAYKCVNPNGRISWVSGTIYYFVNPGSTSVSGTVQLSGRITNNYQTSTYSHASECNGWHFWCPSNGYTTILYGYHKDKNIAVTISLNGGAMLVDSRGGLCVSYNATEGKYFIMSWQTSSNNLHIINTNIDALVADGTGTGTLLTTTPRISHYQAHDTTTQWIAGTNNIIFRDTSNQAMITTLSSTPPYYTTLRLAINAPIVGGVVNYKEGSTWTGTGQIIDVYADHLDTTATIQVRATGVEITE